MQATATVASSQFSMEQGRCSARRCEEQMNKHDNTRPDRLRPPPAERFAGNSHVFDLHAALHNLRAEVRPTQRGHRQITIFQRKPITHVLFAFEAGSELKDHAAHGLVTIYVLEGRLTVAADGQDYALDVGHVLILNPGVPHTVRATDTSAMLLTVHVEDEV
jgi:quercetin dioxygenase-like cupin family protein